MCISDLLESFSDHSTLRSRVSHVLEHLPENVREDLLGDPRFQVVLENDQAGAGWSFFMPLPDVCGNGSRCVVLRSKLTDAPEPFALYVIAHEFAHAFLRNGGWGEISDREEAADSLAASWGFSRSESTQ